MARVRCITEMGMGVDVHGKDATKAAKRAVSDAIRHSSLGFFRMLGKTANDMFVDVTIGVPNPEAVDTAAVAKELPYGTVTVTAGLQKIFSSDPRLGFLAHARTVAAAPAAAISGRLIFNDRLDAIVAGSFIASFLLILVSSAHEWWLVTTGRKARRDRPVEHARVLGILAGDEEDHRMAA